MPMNGKLDLENQTSLSEKEEILLLKYHDGECGYLDNLRVKRLLRRAEARCFLESMRNAMKMTVGRMQQEISQAAAAPTTASASKVWNSVSARIEVEEKTAVLLGERRLAPEQQSLFEFAHIFSIPKFGLSMAGALALALLAVVIVPWGKDARDGVEVASLGVSPDAPSNAVISREKDLQVRPRVKRDPVVSLVSSNVSTKRPRVVFRRYYGRDRNTVEVDWMKSDGRVRVIQSPSDRAGIIWVNRNTERSLGNSKADNGDDEIRILDERIPDTLPAFGSRYSSR